MMRLLGFPVLEGLTVTMLSNSPVAAICCTRDAVMLLVVPGWICVWPGF